MNDIVTGTLDQLRSIDVHVRTGMPGPPGPEGPEGPIGPPGPPGDAAQATTIVGWFGEVRTPEELPIDGFLPADWDGPGRPVSDTQMLIGTALLYSPLFLPDPRNQHLFVFVGDAWADIGTIQGEQGEKGDTGERGERGEQGLRGDVGERGDTGLPGERGERGDPGPRGDTGERGERGEQGERGLQGEQGLQGERGERGDIGETGPPSFEDAPPTGFTFGRLNAAWVQVLPVTGGTINGPLTVMGFALFPDDARVMGVLTLDKDPTLPDHAVTRRFAESLVPEIPPPPDLSPYARLDGAQFTGAVVLAGDPSADMEAVTRRFAESLVPEIPPPPDLSPYARLDGAQFTGPLITQTGSSNTNLGLSLGENSTGFWRTGTYLIAVISGQTAWQTTSSEMLLGVRLNMATQQITNVGAPNAAGDAANRNYVDQRRAPSLLYDVPADIPVFQTQWGLVADLNYSIPRGGDSRLKVSVQLNIKDLPVQIHLMGVRIAGGAERRTFGYAMNANDAAGINVDLFADVTGTLPRIVIEVTAYTVNAANFTVIGGAANALRSQLLITDEGPR